MKINDKIKEMNLFLPDPPSPVAAYIPALRVGDLVFISGTLPIVKGALLYSGKVGREVTIEQGIECARQALLNMLAILKAQIGELERVKQIVRLGGFIASVDGFTQQPQILNGASLLLVDLFGDRGKHVRTAVGAAELPLNAPVELEMIVQVA